MKNSPSTVIEFGPFKDDYQYGELLANHGIGIDELAEDWPEVLESEFAMRGYRACHKRQGTDESWWSY
jgi:hypothetical protein